MGLGTVIWWSVALPATVSLRRGWTVPEQDCVVQLKTQNEIDRWVSAQQRGCLSKRSKLANAVELEAAALTIARAHPSGALALVDFKAAFPPISHEYLMSCVVRPSGLSALGWPPLSGAAPPKLLSLRDLRLKDAGEGQHPRTTEPPGGQNSF